MPSLYTHLITMTLLSSLALSGCHTSPQPLDTPATHAIEVANIQPSDQYIPVQRYGRYTLVELAPQAAQQNLLLQVVDIDLPSSWSISVGDALHYVLLRSGYQLCESTIENAALFALPLPAAHLNLGPVVLRDALQMLAGPSWALQTNDRLREICFTPSVHSAPVATFMGALVESGMKS